MCNNSFPLSGNKKNVDEVIYLTNGKIKDAL